MRVVYVTSLAGTDVTNPVWIIWISVPLMVVIIVIVTVYGHNNWLVFSPDIDGSNASERHS